MCVRMFSENKSVRTMFVFKRNRCYELLFVRTLSCEDVRNTGNKSFFTTLALNQRNPTNGGKSLEVETNFILLLTSFIVLLVGETGVVCICDELKHP